MHTTLRFPLLIIASAALAACATSDPKQTAANPKRPGQWKIEPVLNVKHAENASKSFYTLGRYYDGMRAWDKSIDAYRKSIAADATNVEAHNALGAALAQRQRLDEAEASFRRALALDANLAHVQSNLGYVLMLAGKPAAAVAALKVAVRLDPDNLTNRTNLREALTQWDLARGREPESKVAVVETSPSPDQVTTPTTAANESTATASTATTSLTQVTAAPSLPSTIEVMRPITTATLHAPLPTTVAAAPSGAVVTLARAVPSADLTSIEVARPITSVQATPPSTTVSLPAAVTTVATAGEADAETLTPAPAVAVAAALSSAIAPTQAAPAAVAPSKTQPATVAVVEARSAARPSPPARVARVPITQEAERTLRVVSEPTVPSLTRLGVPAAMSLGALPTTRADQALTAEPPSRREPVREDTSKLLPLTPAQVAARPTPVRFEVLNGNGMPGAARRTGDWLARHGLTTSAIGNDRNFDHRKTIVYYQVGHRDDALRVARALPMAAEVRWARNAPMSQDVRVVLGRDWQTMAACLARSDCGAKRSTALAAAARSAR